MIRLLIADDHLVLLEGLRSLFDDVQDIECVGIVRNGREAIAFAESNELDVILMDINMPVMDGIEATRAITKTHPDVHILALTMLEQGSFIRQMLRSGAKGFLLKNAGKDEVLKAVRSVAVGGQYLGKEATNLLMNDLAGKEHSSTYIPILTRREKEVLRHIADGLSTQEIADALHISFNTVESHKKNLRSKFDARNSAEMVRMAMEKGLLG